MQLTKGFIYVLSNPSFTKGLYKIGYTNATVIQRVKELNASTSVPKPFKVELAYAVKDAEAFERIIHNHFKHYRPNKKREFFDGVTLAQIDAFICELLSGNNHYVYTYWATHKEHLSDYAGLKNTWRFTSALFNLSDGSNTSHPHYNEERIRYTKAIDVLFAFN
jgi:hypothetical protein